jgi:hypothetical protein
MDKQTFNTNFYLAAATVIPILYLALTLQGPGFERFVRSLDETAGMNEPITRRSLTFKNIRKTGAVALMSGLLFLSLYGEWNAVLALYTGYAYPGTGRVVLVSLFALLIAAVAVPFLRILGPSSRGGDDSDESPE